MCLTRSLRSPRLPTPSPSLKLRQAPHLNMMGLIHSLRSPLASL